MSEGWLNDYRDRITDEATEWFARMQDADVNAEERAAFAQWLSASAEHVREYFSLAALHADIGDLPEAPSMDELIQLAAAEQDHNVIPLVASAKRNAPSREASPRVRERRWPRLAAAAGVLIAIVCTWWIARPDANTAVYATGIGEQKSFALPDGSVVLLNAASTVRVKYTDSHRDIQLHSGEALFTVAKNPQRPFRVLTDSTVVQAIGTRFNVRRRSDDVTVTVVEGKVAVTAAADGGAALELPAPLENGAGPWVPVAAGQRARVEQSNAPITVNAVDPELDTAWRERRLVFDSRPLAEVAAEFNLYNEARIEIEHPSVRSIEISGSFYANDPRSFVAFLEEAQLARYTLERDKIILRSAQ